jgi:hypothetical protein
VSTTHSLQMSGMLLAIRAVLNEGHMYMHTAHIYGPALCRR